MNLYVRMSGFELIRAIYIILIYYLQLIFFLINMAMVWISVTRSAAYSVTKVPGMIVPFSFTNNTRSQSPRATGQ